MIQTTDPLLREIDEALRHDRMMAAWKQYRRLFIVFAVVLVAVTLGYTQWQNYRDRKSGEAMEALTAAQTLFGEEKFVQAAEKFATIAADSTTRELADIATLWQARALLGADRKEEAVSLLTQLANTPRSKQLIWRDLACLRLAALDESKATCLTAKDDSPLAAQRKLTQAAIVWHQKKLGEAQTMLESLVNDSETPSSVRDSAKAYLGVVAPMPSASSSAKQR